MLLRRCVVLLVVAFVLAPGGALASVQAKKTDPCKVLTTAEINAALGGAAAAPTTAAPGLCQWAVTRTITNGTQIDTLFVGIGKFSGSPTKEVPANAKAPGAKKIKGIKEAKYAFYNLGENPPIAQVVKSGKLMNVQLTSQLDPTQLTTALVTLTKTAAKRL